jgi:hypothetical protein
MFFLSFFPSSYVFLSCVRNRLEQQAPPHLDLEGSGEVHFWETMSYSDCFATGLAMREASASTVAVLPPVVPAAAEATSAAAEPTPIVAAAQGFLSLFDFNMNSESTMGCGPVVSETVTCA